MIKKITWSLIKRIEIMGARTDPQPTIKKENLAPIRNQFTL